MLVMDSQAKYLHVECLAMPLLLPCSACLQMIKYGVIGTQMLYDDLQYWDTLYIAGGSTKPGTLLQISPASEMGQPHFIVGQLNSICTAPAQGWAMAAH